MPDVFTPESFTFLADLAADNTRAWFRAHHDAYRAHVERPWHALVESVAPHVHALLPELTGSELSRIAARWPRPDAAYRTELTALFRADGAARARLFIGLAADGLRAGLEVPPRSAGWDAVIEALRGGDGAPRLEAWTGRQRLGASPRRGATLRLHRHWEPAAAVAAGPGLADGVRDALSEAAPWYRKAEGTPAADAAVEAVLACLPRSLRAAVAARAAAEGVPDEVWVVYALARAVGGG